MDSIPNLGTYATPATATPDLASYDIILVSSSAGKDSEVMLDLVYNAAIEADCAHKIVVVHCDLGRVEWAGTRELAERQAGQYGVRFEVVSRSEDLLDHIERRGKFPGMRTTQYCTGEHKRNQVYKLLTKLTAELNVAAGLNPNSPKCPQRRILNCLGMRKDESTQRSKLCPFEFDEEASNTKRHVDTWLPVFYVTHAQIWEHIHTYELEYHPAYDLGMDRLSCVFCIYADPNDLLIAGHANPQLLAEYIAVEQRINHTLKPDFGLIQIQAQITAGVEPDRTGAPRRYYQCAA